MESWVVAERRTGDCANHISPTTMKLIALLYADAKKNIAQYSGLPHVNKVGPEGGQILVDQTVRAMQALFPSPAFK